MARRTILVALRWSDIDGYQHVNNVAMLTLLEEARVAAFWTRPADGGDPVGGLRTGPGSGTSTFVARQEIEYLAPLTYTPEPLPIELWVSHVGGASLDVCYEIPGTTGPAARAMTTVVLVDDATGRPRRIDDDERAALQPFLEEPVAFRRRG